MSKDKQKMEESRNKALANQNYSSSDNNLDYLAGFEDGWQTALKESLCE